MMKSIKPLRGFTLIELLVVISIIGLLSTIAGASVMKATKKARNAKRMSDLRVIQKALDTYYIDYGQYPDSAGVWRSECPPYGPSVGVGCAKNLVIPGLVPTYLSTFPADPKMNTALFDQTCYLYMGNSTDYKILDYNVREMTTQEYLSQPLLLDPQRDGGPNGCLIDGASPAGWALYTAGGACW